VDRFHRAGWWQLPHRLRTTITATPKDIDWMTKLGANAYRFGIEWSRLQSAPFAPLNQKELARYIDLLDRLKAAGITPWWCCIIFQIRRGSTRQAAGPTSHNPGVCRLCPPTRRSIERTHFPVEYFQRAGHLRVRGVSARWFSRHSGNGSSGSFVG